MRATLSAMEDAVSAVSDKAKRRVKTQEQQKKVNASAHQSTKEKSHTGVTAVTLSDSNTPPHSL